MELRARCTARNEEAVRIKRLADRDKANADRLVYILQTFLEGRGIERVDTPKHRVAVAGNGGRVPVRIVSQESLPDVYVNRVLMTAPNIDLIREALERGEEVPGAELAPRGKHLRIS